MVRRRYDWSSVDPLLGQVPDADLEKRFGIPKITIQTRRHRKGIKAAKSPAQRRAAPKKGKRPTTVDRDAPPTPLTSEAHERALLRHGDWAAVMPYFFSVTHRDRVGEVVPLYLSALQEHVAEQVQLALEAELEYLMEVDAQGGAVYIPSFRDRLGGETSARQALAKGLFSPFEIGLRINVLKSRRGGSSTFFLCAALRACLSLPNYSACSWSEIRDSMVRIFKLQRVAVDNWREDIALNADVINLGRSASEKHTFGNGSTHIAKTVGTTTRGDRFDFLHLTEYAHYVVMDDVAQSIMVARPHAWVVKETTANGPNHFKTEWDQGREPAFVLAARREGRHDALRGWNGAYNIFFPWWADPGLMLPCSKGEEKDIRASLDAYEQRLIEHAPHAISFAHLKFRRSTIAGFIQQDLEGLTPEAFFDQEYPWSAEAAFQSTARTVFDAEAVAYQDRHIDRRPPSFNLHPENGPEPSPFGLIRIFEKPRRDQAYVLVADVSHGVGFDYADVKVFNRHDGTRLSEAASIHSDRLTPGVLAYLSGILGYLYNDAFIVAEALGGGVGFCDALLNRMGYGHVYFRPATRIENSHMAYSSNPKAGIWWSHPLKAAAVDRLNEDLKLAQHNDCLILRSPHTLEQLRLFSFDGKKYQAPKGHYDDAVACLLMLMLVRSELPAIGDCNVVKKAKGLPADLNVESAHDEIHQWAWGQLDRYLQDPRDRPSRHRIFRRRARVPARRRA